MTRPTPQAAAFRAQTEAEQDGWPPELRKVAGDLQRSLDASRHKSFWQSQALQDGLARDHAEFARLYAEWKASDNESGKQR